jgi:hypothetical protein
LRFSDRAKALGQFSKVQRYGFSFVCTLMCVISLYLALNGFSWRVHSLQRHGNSSHPFFVSACASFWGRFGETVSAEIYE